LAILKRHLTDIIIQAFVLLSALLIAAQLRIQILPLGEALEANYQALPIQSIAWTLGALILILLVSLLLGTFTATDRFLSLEHKSRNAFLASIIASVAMLIFSPALSTLQVLYFQIVVLALILLNIMLPSRFQRQLAGSTISHEIRKLLRYRHLYKIWLRYAIEARYTQTILGLLWIVLLPLATAAVLALAFSQFLRLGRFQGEIPFLVFFYSGIVAYNVFNGGVSKATTSIIGHLDLISRVYFPREILILVNLGETIVDFAFTFIILLMINTAFGIYPNAIYLALLIPLIILILFSLGIMLIVSTWSLLVRDIPQLVGVILQLLFYITPILYPFESIPDKFRFLILLNPLTSLVEAFRDIVVYGKFPEMISLYYPIIISLSLVYVGYSYFKSKEGIMGDLV
jgi:ABC-type polysaccharide/polyol phosphate export permease